MIRGCLQCKTDSSQNGEWTAGERRFIFKVLMGIAFFFMSVSPLFLVRRQTIPFYLGWVLALVLMSLVCEIWKICQSASHDFDLAYKRQARRKKKANQQRTVHILVYSFQFFLLMPIARNRVFGDLYAHKLWFRNALKYRSNKQQMNKKKKNEMNGKKTISQFAWCKRKSISNIVIGDLI